MRTAILLTLLATFFAAVPAQAQTNNMDTWLNQRIGQAVAVRMSLRDPRKVPQIPSGSVTDANLIDRSNMPDIAGISLKLPDQPSSSGISERGATAFSATPFLLLSLLKRNLDVQSYAKSELARRIGLNATFDTDSAGKMTNLIQAKVLLKSRANVLEFDKNNDVGKNLAKATQDYGALRNEIFNYFCSRICDQLGVTDTVQFRNDFSNPNTRDARIAMVGNEGMTAVDALIVKRVDSFVQLRTIIGTLEAQARSTPEVSLGGTFRNGIAGTPNSVRALLIVDWASMRNDLTFNVGYERVEAVDTVEEKNRIAAAGQYLWRLSPDGAVTGRTAMSLALAGSAGIDPTDTKDYVFKVQAKLLLPIAEGMNVPLSVTWASRTDLIDESELRGHVGFTFNVSQLFAAVQ